MKTLYEINWHQRDDKFSHCTVTPITVLREGVLPGCTGVSITAVGLDGRKFQGSPRDYFETEADAYHDMKTQLQLTIEANDAAIERLKEETFLLHKFLCQMAEDTQ